MSVSSGLLSATGRDDVQWVQWIEDRIALCSEGQGDGTRTMIEGTCWIADLAHEVTMLMGEKGLLHLGDGNIVLAQVVSMVLVLWASRVYRAKCYDPKRDAEMARKCLASTHHYDAAIFEAMTDVSKDHVYFPDQGWRSPFVEEREAVE